MKLRTLGTKRYAGKKKLYYSTLFASVLLLVLLQRHQQTKIEQNLERKIRNSKEETQNITRIINETSSNLLRSIKNSESSSTSSFISLKVIPSEERIFQPGPYAYSKNHTLIITGASITGDYHRMNDTLWLQIFAIGDKPFQSDRERCKYTNKSWSELYHWPKWELMHKEPFQVKIGNSSIPLQFIPQHGIDSNTLKVVQIWRANITSLISESNFYQFHEAERRDDIALPVELIHGHDQRHKYTVLKLYFPISDPAVGLNEIKSNQTKGIMHQKHDVTLCAVVHPNGLKNIHEWLQYHYNTVGIDHIHLGLDSLFATNTDSDKLSASANGLLEEYINTGRLSLSSVWDNKVGLTCQDRDIPKMQFYQTCLYRAKSTSEFMAIWDADEFFYVKKDSLRHLKLGTLLRQIDHEGCHDWSFVTMESSTAGRGDKQLPFGQTGIVSLDYPLRENMTNRVWQKSISRTKNVFSNSIHIPSSSLPQGKGNLTDVLSLVPDGNNDCAFYLKNAIMIHARGVQRQGGENREDLENAISNELVSLLAQGNK
ncbi:predicted protein [Chaetoceros tenuissimus]|uniref:Glycosyltransferase family 92 protein n=1 Tax=Chaetoceros tenuissimus TaxID=426638 RepID=A0AAD3D6E6_9STRA|nr:predicted protein [Chaetoceros tenuissimus]